MSDWDTPDLSFDAFVNDLECVANCLELEQFDLFAISRGRGGPPSPTRFGIPERVLYLVILNGYTAGWRFAIVSQGDRAALGYADAHGNRLGRG